MIINKDFKPLGCYDITKEDKDYAFTGMDFTILRLGKGQIYKRAKDNKEFAILLVEGSVVVSACGKSTSATRSAVFKINGYAWHCPCGEDLEIKSIEESELLLIAAENDTSFDPKIYSPKDVKVQRLGDGLWDNAGLREVLTFFDYDNAPYSKLVLGEVFALPGRWSSYPPHCHSQPEIYYYRFDKPQGFGAAFLNDEAHTIKDRNILLIPGGINHPQVAAAGYSMYFAWTIKHLDGNPWTVRHFDPVHQWLMDDNVNLWNGLPK